MPDSTPLSDADTRVTSLSAGDQRALGPASAERLGPYRLLRKLGTGGMAEVFLAQAERERSELVVVKRMLPQLAEQRRFLDMFQREARVAMRLDHPNIVKVYGLVEDRGQIGLVMEYLEGLTLYDLAVRAWDGGRSLPLEPLVKMLADAARALHFAHHLPDEQGGTHTIVHRDVSPDNLLVTKQGVTKLLDFGVAKPDDDHNLTRTGQVKGKVSYMSPEQARGEKLDGRSDLFSLGVSFYWLLTGIRPFDREHPVATMEAVVLGEVPRPTELNAVLPRPLELVVLRLLERDRRFRTATGHELAQQLEQLLARVPRDYMSPARLLENVLDTEPQPEGMPWPEHVAVPSVDWVSGEQKALNDPSSPRPLTGEWAALETRQFPVFGRSAFDDDVPGESSASGVFTSATLDAVVDAHAADTVRMNAAPAGDAAELEAPPTVRLPSQPSSFSSDIATDPEHPLTGPVTQPSLPIHDVGSLALPPNRDPDTSPNSLPPRPLPAPTVEMPAASAPFDPRSVSLPTFPAVQHQSARSPSTAPLVAGVLLLSLLTSAALVWALLVRDQRADEALPSVTALAAAQAPTTTAKAPPIEPTATEPSAPSPNVEPPPTPPPRRQQTTKPRVPKVAERTVHLVGPAHVSWKLGKRSLGRGERSASVPEQTSSVRAYDTRRRVSVKVPLVDGTARFDAMLSEELVVRVRPWAKVWLGDEALGMTPLSPVRVAPGRYKLKLEWEGTVRERSVRVTRGAGQVVVNVDMRAAQ